MMAFKLAIIGLLLGIVLGRRYKVLILVPTVLFAMVFAIAIGIARADSFWSIVLATVALVAALQFGYVAGALTHAVIAAIFSQQKEDRNSDPGRNSDPEISYAWRPIWQLDG